MESLIQGADGLIRGATIRIHSSDKRSTLLRRPLQLLYPLEVHHCCDTVDNHVSNSNTTPPEIEQCECTEVDTNDLADSDQPNSTQIPRRRSRRIAAGNAREIIHIQAEDS